MYINILTVILLWPQLFLFLIPMTLFSLFFFLYSGKCKCCQSKASRGNWCSECPSTYCSSYYWQWGRFTTSILCLDYCHSPVCSGLCPLVYSLLRVHITLSVILRKQDWECVVKVVHISLGLFWPTYKYPLYVISKCYIYICTVLEAQLKLVM